MVSITILEIVVDVDLLTDKAVYVETSEEVNYKLDFEHVKITELKLLEILAASFEEVYVVENAATVQDYLAELMDPSNKIDIEKI